ncbi:MAG: NADH-quinone oxidoreductase subunit N [Phycisphaerales bacterium]
MTFIDLTLSALPMAERVKTLYPEIALFAATCLVMIVGLSKSYPIRKTCGLITFVALGIAGILAHVTFAPANTTPLVNLPHYGKIIVAIVGMLLSLLIAGTADRDYEAAVAKGEPFNPLRAVRAEFYSFFLFSLTGLMLCAGADDLIWLFLALELTSLPTYIMVTISTRHNRSMEAGVKYFFLGALGAATFLYGFAMLYGGTGSTNLAEIQRSLAEQAAGGGINGIAMTGLLLSVVGIAFKIAAVPMHFYTPDVYQGASSPIAAFLAFVPKTAGFFALLLIVSCVGWNSAGGKLPEPLHQVLWIMAALTMTVGNVLALLQNSVKRVLAYSSIAHSGYMLVGLIAGPGEPGAPFTRNGLAAVMFYLLAYGIMNLGAFAALACLERTGKDGKPDEVDSFADLRGLCRSSPVLGYTMVLSALGLLGLPPTLGFFSKLPLFTSAISAGEITLVVILGLNSAVAAFYYLRLAGTPWLETLELTPGHTPPRLAPFFARTIAGVCSAVGVVLLAIVPYTSAAKTAAEYRDRGTNPNKPALMNPAPTPAENAAAAVSTR